jgi:hypothetical protein
MGDFDWHADENTKNTRIDSSYKNTQKMRRFFRSRCGDDFKFDRSFMLWMKQNSAKTMDEAVAEWLAAMGRKRLSDFAYGRVLSRYPRNYIKFAGKQRLAFHGWPSAIGREQT